jgi:predicted O-linked N-acetylglucosamine transferase (SPINDLY family)
MLLRLIKNFFAHRTMSSRNSKAFSAREKSEALLHQGDFRSAIPAYRNYLKDFPYDVAAMNDLGCCLANTGDDVGAATVFDQAFSLDDTYLPVVVNHAKSITDRQRSAEALPYLRQAKVYDADFYASDAVLGAIALAMGNAELACRYARRAWLASFDNLRLANCYLLNCAYHDIDEAQLAAEHRFWAETIAPHARADDAEAFDVSMEALPECSSKIRIGYWSPDFRNHSVRYFFWPLLENHDRNRFEIVLYHDIPKSDEYTAQFREKADHFIDVSALPDTGLVALIRSHHLDVLIELAGHTSNNRVNLLQERLATVQLSGLGYPPTTGLRTVDAKLLDVHIAAADCARYYAEIPLVLPNSFWCFDPMQEALIDPVPPALRNGYPTFACIGNIAKISYRTLACWAEILQRVPNARLLLRSISFNDPAAIDSMRERVAAYGIALDRVDFCGPAGGADFFASYNEVDIVLDTYPFNGGTTSCFAAYMGVPIVSLAGHSLISRMGKSILNNLDLSDWVVDDQSAYVERAVTGAADLSFLARFRVEARERFLRTALGDGKRFAEHLERSCMELLQAKRDGTLCHENAVAPLPAQELVRRAYGVLRFGQYEAAQRIVDYCLRAYPNCGTAHILNTQRLTIDAKYDEAAAYLLDRVDSFDASDRFAAWVNIARFYLLLGRNEDCRKVVKLAATTVGEDACDLVQLRMLETCLNVRAGERPVTGACWTLDGTVSITVLIVVDDPEVFVRKRDGIASRCEFPAGVNVSFLRCSEHHKARVYSAVLRESTADVVLIVHKNIEIYSASFLRDLVLAMEHCDLLGIAGARTWDRLDWRQSPAHNKVASFMVPNDEEHGGWEIQLLGMERNATVHALSVLDGSLLAINRARLAGIEGLAEFDPLLEDGAALMEEELSHRAHLAGLRLTVHQSLGVVLDWRVALRNLHLGEVRWQLTQRYGFDPLILRDEDRTIISVPVASPDEGVVVQQLFFEESI